MSSDFSPDQKRYLEGFVSGLSASRVSRAGAPAKPEPVGPDAIHFFTRQKAVTSRWLDPSHGGINLGFPQNG